MTSAGHDNEPMRPLKTKPYSRKTFLTSLAALCGPPKVTFDPGNLIPDPHGLLLSVGLKARLIAQAGSPVPYQSGTQSSSPFHALPDFGATFRDTRPENPGGWIYVSNSEVRQPWYQGGVGAITFNSRGETIDYRMILTNTTANCGGGVTPWGTYVTGEEYREGVFWQVDPTGQRPSEKLTVGIEMGVYESFAADPIRNQYFITEDTLAGPVRRFVPSINDPSDPWKSMHGPGTTTYLTMNATSAQEGTYAWISSKSAARPYAQAFYPFSEGIDVHGDQLYFVSKTLMTVYVLDLAGNTYTSFSTRQGLFQGQPDQLIQFKDRRDAQDIMFFYTEDGDTSSGIHARNTDGEVLTILEGPTYSPETTGLAFSPDFKRMYVAFQVDGVLFEVMREDGLPFTARTLNVRYHSSSNNVNDVR
ncbi:hypothetical protein FisN_13Lh307 [Fistulifera solaris]|uniref:DUF839 domain-containing protein n=1 Tax=Fistulifera solaris TaxID=1519565 RepID=A0A1Z5KLF2_FISSO|nr:hypothetical protein FisN_13Lh307 [Fistulifera solaris]|eukprot:GAX27143.1 hypothetical protein FisN_13Lh307 [Fistulifera solaris]